MKVLEKYFATECKKMINEKSITMLMHEFSDLVDEEYADLVVDPTLGDKWLLPIQKVLAISLEIVNKGKHENMLYVTNPEIKQHFDRIFSIQKDQLEKRLSKYHGYISPIAMPGNGNPLYYIDFNDKMDADQLIPAYRPSNTVLTWFQFRDNFVFGRFLKAEGIKEKLEEIFNFRGSPPALKIEYDILKTIAVNYTIRTQQGSVDLIVDDYYLPKIDNLHNAVVKHSMKDYVIYNHLIFYIELIEKRSGQFKKFNVVLCPLKFIYDSSYKTKIKHLISLTFNLRTRKYKGRQARIRLMNTTTAKLLKDQKLKKYNEYEQQAKSNIFLYTLTSRLIKTIRWYREIIQLEKSQFNLYNQLNANWLCSYCRDRRV